MPNEVHDVQADHTRGLASALFEEDYMLQTCGAWAEDLANSNEEVLDLLMESVHGNYINIHPQRSANRHNTLGLVRLMAFIANRLVPMHVCMCVCAYVYVHVYVWMSVCMYVCMYASMDACMHVYVRVYVYGICIFICMCMCRFVFFLRFNRVKLRRWCYVEVSEN